MTTTAEVYSNLIAQFEASLGQSVPVLPVAFLRVLAKALAGLYIVLYKYIGAGVLQGFVQTASASPTEVNGKTITPLEFWGELIGVGLPRRATAAELTATVSVQVLGGVIPAGTQLVYPSTGVTYLTKALVALSASTVAVAIRAAGDQGGGDGSGAIGNLSPGDVLYFANPQAAIASAATVATVTTTGADAEAPEDYRQRIIDRFRARPQGGALADYRAWATSPAGIKAAYPYRSTACPGQVLVYIESSTSADGVPTSPQLLAALDAINAPDARPVTALANVLPINRLPFDVQVNGLVAGDPVATQAEITAQVSAYLLARRPYIDGLDYPPAQDRVTLVGLAGVVDRVTSAVGATFSTVTVTLYGLGTPAYTLGPGQLAKLGVISFD